MRLQMRVVMGGLVALGLSGAAVPQEPPEIPKELARQGAQALRAKKSKIEGSLGIVHEWVERLQARGQHKAAAAVLRRAVAAAPGDMICQGMYAETLRVLGQEKAAEKKGCWVLVRAREDRARNAALRACGEPVPGAPEKLEKKATDPVAIVLVPLPPVDIGLVQAVGKRMTGMLPIEVRVRSFPFKPLPEPTRGSMLLEIGRHRARFDKEATAAEVKALLKATGLTGDDLRLSHAFVGAYRCWLMQTDRWKELRLFDQEVTREFRPQWWSKEIVDKSLNEQLGFVRRATDILILVTSADIFMSEDMGYNFAVSGRRWSLVSYNRFLPWFTREEDSWDRLVSRTVKQCLCSVGRSVGVVKCSDATCVCSYANGLQDHDRKVEEYCTACRERIEAALRN